MKNAIAAVSERIYLHIHVHVADRQINVYSMQKPSNYTEYRLIHRLISQLCACQNKIIITKLISSGSWANKGPLAFFIF